MGRGTEKGDMLWERIEETERNMQKEKRWERMRNTRCNVWYKWIKEERVPKYLKRKWGKSR